MYITERPHFSLFPGQIQQEVFLRLPLKSIKLAQLVCRDWRSIIVQDTFWKRFKLEVRLDNLEAIKQLALFYLVESKNPQDESYGFDLAQKFAEEISKRELVNPVDRLLFSLAEIQIGGLSFTKDLDITWECIPWLKTLAEKENPFGLYVRALSNKGYFGLNIADYVFSSQNNSIGQKDNSLKDLQMAYQKGFIAALHVLARLDERHLELLSQQETPEARFYAYLIRREKSLVCSQEDLQKSAEAGYHWSQYALACRSHGKEALKWALKAAVQGNVLAQFYVGQEKDYALKRIPLDDEEKRWIAHAAEAGEGSPYFYFGDLCSNNDEEMTEEEIESYESIREDSIYEQWLEIPSLFASLYSSGSIIPKNEAKALEYSNQVKARSKTMARS